MEGNPGLLPAEVLWKIFSYCSYRDLVQCQLVCRWWQQVSRHKQLWRDIVYTPDERDKAEDIIENLKATPDLRALHLMYVECSVSKELVVKIAKACPRLEQLSVCWRCLYENFHYKMRTIKVLILDIHVDDHIDIEDYFEYLHYCFPNVEQLDCNDLTFDPASFRAYLRKKQKLHTLAFSCEDLHYDGCILPYLSLCPNLKTLTLYCVCNIIADLRVESVKHLKNISSLTLRKTGRICYLFYDDSYLSMFRCFPSLVVLVIDRCVISLEDEKLLLIIAENCPLIEKLTLSFLFIEDENLQYVSNFKKLTSLCLKRCRKITDACVAHLEAILELRHLEISVCRKMTPKCLFSLCSFAQLQTLKFDLQDKDPPADLCASHVKNPDLHIMFYNCKNTSVLDRLRSQRLRISLLKHYQLYRYYDIRLVNE